MKSKDILKLEKGAKLIHSYYGPCDLVEVMMSMGRLFGIQVRPTTQEGLKRLWADSGIDQLPKGDKLYDAPFLEDSPRRLSLVAA